MKLFKKTVLALSMTTILSAGTAHAQYVYGQPSMAQSLGQALGAGISGNYSGSGYTTYYPAGSTGVSTSGGIGDAWGSFLSGRSSAWNANKNINGSNINNSSTSSRSNNGGNLSDEEKKQADSLNKDIDASKRVVKDHDDEAKKGANNTKKEKSQEKSSPSPYTILDSNTQLSVTGVAHVLDGITMTVGKTLVTLHGMIAPGNGQMCNGDGVQYACGDKARENLAELVNNKKVACTGWGSEGECVLIDDQTNINNVVLSQGIAQPE